MTKQFILILFTLNLVSACGKDPTDLVDKLAPSRPSIHNEINQDCSTMPFLGVWSDTANGDTLTLDKFCVVKGTSCGYRGSVDFLKNSVASTANGATTYQVVFSINQVIDSASCLDAEENICSVKTYANDLNRIQVKCLNGTFDYTR